MISYARLKNLWYEGIILLLINVYFTTFYSTIYNQNITISNEKNINDIIRLQSDTLASMYEKKIQDYNDKGSVKEFMEERDTIFKIDVRYESINDEQIEKIVNMFYASSWMNKLYNSSSNMICSFGGLMTLIFLLIITYRLTGLINILYVGFCLYHIFNFRKFLKPAQYSLPKHIRFLKLLLYFDLLLNIAYQVPIKMLHSGDSEKSWQIVIGIFSFCKINPDNEDLIFTNINVIITKALMFCLVILLDNLLNSSTYKQFVTEKLVYFQQISTTKARCLTYLYNNNKLRKIIKIQYEKDAMTHKIKLVKNQLHLWNKKYLSTEDINKVRNTTLYTMTEKSSSNVSRIGKGSTVSNFKMRTFEEVKEENEELDDRQDDINETPNEGTGSFMEFDDLQRMKKYDIIEEEEELLQELKRKNLNWFTRVFNWVKRYYSNQMLLISSSKRLEAIEDDLRHGKHKINTTLENKILLSHYVENDENNPRIRLLNASMPEKFRIENMDYKEESVKKSFNRFQMSTILGILVSNSSILCYLFMIFAHIVGGSLITLIYPVSIFCYAIFEEIRPTKAYWKFILMYTMVILIIKSIFKLFYISDHIPARLNMFLMNFRIGIEKVTEDSEISSSYYIFEVLIMLFVVMHMISLMFQGLWDEREIDIETVDEAAQRITSYHKNLFNNETKAKYEQFEEILRPRARSLDLELFNKTVEEEEKEIRIVKDNRLSTFARNFIDTYRFSEISEVGVDRKEEENVNLLAGKFSQTLASRWRNAENLRGMPRSRIYFGVKNIGAPDLFERNLGLFDQDILPNDDKIFFVEPPRALTEYIYEEMDYEDAQKFINEEIKQAGFIKTYWGRTKQKILKNKYFNRLFPRITAQKPGKDFYVPMACVQFLIVVYIVLFFSLMEREYTNTTSQKLQIRQFSALLVLAAFLQVFIMLLDRYIYISKTFTTKKEEEENDDIFDEVKR
jgi:hypothetical protein